MKFLSIYSPNKPGGDSPPTKEHMATMGAFVEEMMKSGKLLATGGLGKSAMGACVRSVRGEISIVDGPFTEAKEVIAGFALIEVKSKEEAIEMTKRFLELAGDGETVLHRVVEGDELPQ